MRKTIGFVCAAAMLVSVTPWRGAAQDAEDVAAYLAMVFTPIGALPPMVTPPMAGSAQTRNRINARYGRISFNDAVAFNNLGVGIDFDRDGGSWGLVLGYMFDDCEGDCDGVVMFGADLEGVLASSQIGQSPNTRLNMGWRGDVGISRSDDLTSLTGVIGVPLSVSAQSGSLRIVPFFTPAFGFGRLSDDNDSESGVRFLLGGGLGVMSSTGLALNIGFQKVFIDGGDTQVGLGVAWNLGS